MMERGQPRTVVFTGPLAVDLDERQYELGFGPCLDAAKTGQTIVVDTGSDDSPYREFGRIAARAGVRHTVSVGMPLAQRSIGGMNIYKTAEGPLSPAFLEHAEVFAGYAAVAVNNVTSYAGAANEAANLRAAMQSRAVIEQAKGILMARDRCTADEAFDCSDASPNTATSSSATSHKPLSTQRGSSRPGSRRHPWRDCPWRDLSLARFVLGAAPHYTSRSRLVNPTCRRSPQRRTSSTGGVRSRFPDSTDGAGRGEQSVTGDGTGLLRQSSTRTAGG